MIVCVHSCHTAICPHNIRKQSLHPKSYKCIGCPHHQEPQTHRGSDNMENLQVYNCTVHMKTPLFWRCSGMWASWEEIFGGKIGDSGPDAASRCWLNAWNSASFWMLQVKWVVGKLDIKQTGWPGWQRVLETKSYEEQLRELSTFSLENKVIKGRYDHCLQLSGRLSLQMAEQTCSLLLQMAGLELMGGNCKEADFRWTLGETV